MCYAAASADNCCYTRQGFTTCRCGNVAQEASPTLGARLPSIATGSEDLFSEEEDDKPPDRVPSGQRPLNTNRDSKVVRAAKRKSYSKAVVGEERRQSKRAARPHPSQKAAKRKLNVALSDEESFVVEIGAATEAYLKGGYSSDESLASEQNKFVSKRLQEIMTILALFFRNETLIKTTCATHILPAKSLPIVEYLSFGHWIISSPKSFVLSTSCLDTTRSYAQTITSGLNSIQLKNGCSANSTYFTIPTTFEQGNTDVSLHYQVVHCCK